MSNLDDLSHLTSVGGAFDLDNNPSLTNVDGLSNLNAVYSVFNLANNQSLTNVDGLSNLTVVGSSFSLAMNPSLKDISGISNLIDFHIIYLDNENSNNSHYRNSFDIKIDGASDVFDILPIDKSRGF